MDNKVLLVEDDPVTRELLLANLSDAGLQVTGVESLAAARQALREEVPNLLILDLRLPDGDGIELARELSGNSSLGLIIITARNDPIDVVVGLEIGADDYVCKPFNVREVVARIRAILRRLDSRRPEMLDPINRVLRFQGWTLVIENRRLLDPGGREITLSRSEFDLLRYLVENTGRVQSRDQLLDAIGSAGSAAIDRTIDVLIGRLRRKIETDPRNPLFIRTIQGVGYRFAVPVTHESSGGAS